MIYNFSINRYINKNYEVVDSVKFYQWMSKPDPLVKGDNFDQIVRGMGTSAGRLFTPSYNFFVSTICEYFPFVCLLKNINVVQTVLLYKN